MAVADNRFLEVHQHSAAKPVNPIYKIALVGPESTGKSALAEALATRYQTAWVPEYAREYINRLNRPYNATDIVEIAFGQLEAEEALLPKANAYLFCDTTALVEKVWLQNAFGQTDPFIESCIVNRVYHFYLLTNIDLPWQPDPQREHPHLREHFYNIYKNLLITYGFPFAEISGTGPARIEAAVQALQQFRAGELWVN